MNDEKPAEIDMADWDAARRLGDAVNIHVMASLETGRDRPGFVAIRLSDGRSPDGALYDTRADCTRHQPNRDIFPCKVGKDTISAEEAWMILKFARQGFSNGVVFTDEAPVMPQLPELHPQAGAFPRIDLSKWGYN